jgi:hypothetical protein
VLEHILAGLRNLSAQSPNDLPSVITHVFNSTPASKSGQVDVLGALVVLVVDDPS